MKTLDAISFALSVAELRGWIGDFVDLHSYPFNIWDKNNRHVEEVIVVAIRCRKGVHVFFDGILQYSVKHPTQAFEDDLLFIQLPTKEEFLANRKRWDRNTPD